MYVWNGFSIVGKRKDLSENLLVTVEKAEEALQNQSKCRVFVSALFPLQSLPGAHLPMWICASQEQDLSWCLGGCLQDKGRMALFDPPVNGCLPQKNI